MRAFLVLLVIFVAVPAVFVAADLLEGSRRTAEAPITVLDLQPQETIGRAGPIPGWLVSYSFRTADGQTRTDEAFRTWDEDEIQAGKVCYEPADPANNELIRPSLACPR